MSDVNKSVSIALKANLSQLEAGLAKLPSMTEKEARAMVRGLSKELKKSERAARDAARANKKQLEIMRRQAKRTRAEFKQMGANIGTSVAAAGVALFAFQQQIADLSNELVDSATKTGLSVDTLSGLRLAAEGAGLSFGDLERGLIKLPSQMLKVQQKSKKQTELFDRLKVDVLEYRDGFEQLRDADDVLKDLFVALQNVSSEEERAALAAELFGQQAGPKLIQSGALNNLESFVSLASEFGVSTGPAMKDAMAEFQRVSSAALTLAQGELSRLMTTIMGESGMSEAILLISDGMIAFGIIATKQIEIVRAGFSLLTGTITNAYEAITTGDVTTAAENNIRNTRELVDAVSGLGSMFSEITERQSKFRAEVAKTISAPETAGGAGGGEGDADELAEAQQKAQAAEKSLKELKSFSLRLEKEIKKAQLDRLEGQERLSEQIRQRVVEIEAEIVANDLLTQSIINKRDAAGDYLLTEQESSDLSAKTSERELQLRQEISDLSKQLITDSLDFEIAAGIAALDHDTEMTMEKIANRRQISEEEQKIQKQQLATSQLVFQSISEGAAASLEIAQNSFIKNKALIGTLFAIKKAAALGEIAIATAVGFQSAYEDYGTFAPIAQAAILASGVAQAAVVLSQQPPKLHMGGVVRASPDEQTRTLLTGEAVLDRATVQRIGGEDGVNRLQSGASSEPIVVVTNPFKHFDRFMRDRKRAGAERRTGRTGY